MIPEGAVTFITADNKIFIAGGAISRNIFEVDEYEQKLINRAQFPSCAHDRSAFGHCVIKNIWYVVSGLYDQDFTKEPTPMCHVLNLNGFVWTELPPVINAGVGCTLVTFNEDIILKFGGVDSQGKPINIIEQLTPQCWKVIPYTLDRYYN